MNNNQKLNEEIARIRTESKFLARSVLLEETGSKRYVHITILVCSLLLVSFIVWSAVMEVDEVAIAEGSIVPKGELIKIQHLLGGKVSRILVREGEYVEKDAIVIEIDPENSQLLLGELNVEYQELKAAALWLRALIDETKPTFTLGVGEYSEIYKDQMELYTRNKAQDKSGENIIVQQIEQVKLEIAELKKKQIKLKKDVGLLTKEHRIRKKLVSKGLNSKLSIITLERDLNDAQGELAESRPKLKRLRVRLKELRTRRIEYSGLRKKQYAEELTKTKSALLMLQQKQVYLSSNLDYLKIRSTASGYVHGLQVNASGEVVNPGETLFQIVPADRILEAHLKIAAADIGHLKTGQSVLIKFKTFNYRRYGGVHGVLSEISNSAFLDENGNSFYRGIARLSDDADKLSLQDKQIIPGMTITADIKTGTKTVLEYLLRPLYSSTETAFSER
ncbi:MAG: HlyD family type I secretion periplasmic adaptor subunit [Fibrobacterales bacterium]